MKENILYPAMRLLYRALDPVTVRLFGTTGYDRAVTRAKRRAK